MLMTSAAFAEEHAVAENKDSGNNFDDFLTAGDDNDDDRSGSSPRRPISVWKERE